MSCCAATVANPQMVEETAARLERLEEARILAASTQLESNRYKTDFIVPDMHCAGCIGTIERGLVGQSPVEQVRANLSLRTVSVIWKRGKGSILEVSRQLDALGFAHHLADAPVEADRKNSEASSLLLALAVAGFAAANIMLLSVSVWSGAEVETARLFHLISGLIAIPAVAFSGRPFFRSAMRALSARRLNMDVPISLAVLLALAMSIYESMTGGEEAYFDASVTLLFFLLIGRYLDHLMRQKARGAVGRLSSLSAKGGALVNDDGEISHIDLKDIRPGMLLRVFAGERFPVNGTVVAGATDLDRSHVTGESESVFAETGEMIEAGALNLTSAVDIRTTTSAQDSFLAEMHKMLEAAEKGRGNYIRIADRMAQIYAPAVHLLALITFIAWMVASGGDWHTSIYTAIAVLIITCPCALGLAVPVAHVIGANRLMQNGILMRDGTGIERLADIDRVVFDKTGTLTSGTPIVVASDRVTDADAAVLKALANSSSHPVARAVDLYLDCRPADCISDLVEVPGFGVEARANGKQVRLGKPDWVAEISSGEMELAGKSASAGFAFGGQPMAGFVIEDSLRQGGRAAIDQLARSGLELEILSGDHADKVRKIADAVGIDAFHADQSPADKIAHMKALAKISGKPLMVGDGINDAPALAAGHVSMVPASASDVGRHAADFVFTRNSLLAVPTAFAIARKTDRIVRQNFGLAIAYNCIAVPLAMAGLVTPLFAAIAMSASSILVVANSFRINLGNVETTVAVNEPDVVWHQPQEAAG